MQLAQAIAAKSPLAIRGTRTCSTTPVRPQRRRDLVDRVATWNAAMLLSDDLQAAIRAGFTKQPPPNSATERGLRAWVRVRYVRGALQERRKSIASPPCCVVLQNWRVCPLVVPRSAAPRTPVSALVDARRRCSLRIFQRPSPTPSPLARSCCKTGAVAERPGPLNSSSRKSSTSASSRPMPSILQSMSWSPLDQADVLHLGADLDDQGRALTLRS